MLRDLEHPRRDPRWSTAAWVSAAFVFAIFLAVDALSSEGVGRAGILLSLRVTGRLAFLLFWLFVPETRGRLPRAGSESGYQQPSLT